MSALVSETASPHAMSRPAGFDPDGQTLPAKPVEDVQCAECPTVVGAMMHEVIRPNVIAILGPQADTRSVV